MNICTSNMDGDISKSSFSKHSILVKDDDYLDQEKKNSMTISTPAADTWYQSKD
jgi:hypothetical protein